MNNPFNIYRFNTQSNVSLMIYNVFIIYNLPIMNENQNRFLIHFCIPLLGELNDSFYGYV